VKNYGAFSFHSYFFILHFIGGTIHLKGEPDLKPKGYDLTISLAALPPCDAATRLGS